MNLRLKPCEVTGRIAKLMNKQDRKANGIRTPAEIHSAAESRAEKELQKLCEQELNRRGIVYLHLSFRAREKKGWPDLTFAIHGFAIAVELKTGRGKLSPDQIKVLKQMETPPNNWIVFVIRSFDSFVDLLNGWKKPAPDKFHPMQPFKLGSLLRSEEAVADASRFISTMGGNRKP